MKNIIQLNRFIIFQNKFKNQHLLFKVFLVFSLLNSNFFYSKENATNFKGANIVVEKSISRIDASTTDGNLTMTASGSYTWASPLGSGLTYTTSGVYTHTTTNTTGFPNVATLNLTITVNTFTIGTSCGKTITSLTVTINTPIVAGATTYTFRVKNLVTNAIQTIVRSVNSFALSNYTGITLGTPYEIEVSTNGGVNYGPACLLNTPSPFSNIGAQCGTSLTSMSEYVYCTSAPNVTGYRFRVTNTTTNVAQLFSTIINRFNFNQLVASSFGTTYLVEVALRNTDGITYLPYNSGCEITTPSFPTTKIRPIQCNEYQALSNTENFVAVIIFRATDYSFYLFNTSLGYSNSIARPSNKFNLDMFTGLVSGTIYSVQVAVKIDGVWGPYGAICKIITPVSSKTITTNSTNFNEFKAIAYPNPFAEDFMFTVNTASQSTIQIRVYDMLGKQIENRDVAISDIENLQIGVNYPAGVYNVILSQEDTTKNLRVIKR